MEFTAFTDKSKDIQFLAVLGDLEHRKDVFISLLDNGAAAQAFCTNKSQANWLRAKWPHLVPPDSGNPPSDHTLGTVFEYNYEVNFVFRSSYLLWLVGQAQAVTRRNLSSVDVTVRQQLGSAIGDQLHKRAVFEYFCDFGTDIAEYFSAESIYAFVKSHHPSLVYDSNGDPRSTYTVAEVFRDLFRLNPFFRQDYIQSLPVAKTVREPEEQLRSFVAQLKTQLSHDFSRAAPDNRVSTPSGDSRGSGSAPSFFDPARQ